MDVLRLGLIDVGGGLRGVYGAGVLDRCLEDKVQFDLCIGVSAGSANTASFLAGQKGRNYRFYTDYARRKDYMSFRNFLRDGSYLGLPYIYGILSNADGEDPLDYAAICENPAQWLIVSTEAQTGKPYYFTKADMKQDDYTPLMASCCIPGVNKPVRKDGVLFFDGGLSDPMPIEKALACGCDHLVVILTKPLGELPTAKGDILLADLLSKKYPKASYQLLHRAEYYNASLRCALEMQKEGKALLVAPRDIAGLKTLTRDKTALQKLYEMGKEDGKQIATWLSSLPVK